MTLNKAPYCIGLFGGTFDPIHQGHLHCAQHAVAYLQLDTLHFIPNRTPVHGKKPQASTLHRVAMLELAIQAHSKFEISTLELDRKTPSYSVETLIAYRQRYPQASLQFLLGMDAFAQLQTWHRWQELLDYAHLIVLARERATKILDQDVAMLLHQHEIQQKQDLNQTVAGKIYCLHQPLFSCSSSQVRAQLLQRETSKILLPQVVADYIQEKGLYRV